MFFIYPISVKCEIVIDTKKGLLTRNLNTPLLCSTEYVSDMSLRREKSFHPSIAHFLIVYLGCVRLHQTTGEGKILFIDNSGVIRPMHFPIQPQPENMNIIFYLGV